MAETYYDSGMGRLWIQEEGPLHPWELWGDAGVGDMEVPMGDITPYYLPSDDTRGEFEIVAETQGAPGNVTTTIEMPRSIATRLLAMECAFNMLIMYSQCERPDSKVYDVADYISVARLTGKTIPAPVARQPDDQTLALVSGAVSARSWMEICSPVFTDQAAAVTSEDLMDVVSADDPSCGGICGERTVGCQVLYAVGANNVVLKTTNGGGTWTDIGGPTGWAGSPGDTINAVYAQGDFVIVGSGDDEEIGVSTDGGSTWTEIDLATELGASNFVNAIFGLDKYHIWIAADGGVVLFSSDGGLTWEDVSPATTEDLYGIHFLDTNRGIVVGDNGAVATTVNGGSAWTARTVSTFTAKNVKCCAQTDTYIMVVAGVEGRMAYSLDGGDTWTQKTTALTASDTITALMFSETNFGYYTADTGDVYRTDDGGYSWEAMDITANSGLNGVWACTPSTVSAVGASGFVTRGTCGNEAMSS